MHFITVARADPKTPPKGPIGAGRQLVRWTVNKPRDKGLPFLRVVNQATTSQFVLVWKRMSFKIVPLSETESLTL